MDPVRTEIMKNRLLSIVEEAATVAYRTAHTTFVKQTQDFRVSLATLDGEYFAVPMMTGAGTGVGASLRPTVDVIGIENFEPGDIVITNDPFSSGGLCTHTMDIHMIRPVFRGDRLLCFAWSFIHASDIGGAVPGSISPANTEVYQEGFRLRPMKLYRRGERNADVAAIMHDNSRIGAEIWGDLQAMMSAMALMDKRVQELCDKVGDDDLLASVADVLDYAEIKAREVIGSIQDGVYEFSDYVEGMKEGEVVFLHGRLTIRDDRAEIDFRGSDPQAQASLNFVTGGDVHPFLSLALANYIQTMEPTIPVNSGLLRPIRTRAPEGTVMNAAFPAASGNRWVAVMRVHDVVLGCLAQAIPGGLVACGAGQAGIILAAWVDAATARRRVSTVEPFSGGSGGRRIKDGVDATDSMIGHIKSAPIETVEIDTPLVIRRHSLEPDSFGHGKFRGGASICFECETRIPETIFTVRGLDRFRFQPWGFDGGSAGRNGRTFLNPGTPRETELGKITVLTLRQGELLQMVSPSGGGFGDPLARDPERVLRDVLDELLSSGLALSVYGVVIKDRAVDVEATRVARLGLAKGRNSPGRFAFGPARDAFETLWPNDASVALANAVLGSLAGLRPHLMAAARQELAALRGPITPSMVERTIAALQPRVAAE